MSTKRLGIFLLLAMTAVILLYPLATVLSEETGLPIVDRSKKVIYTSAPGVKAPLANVLSQSPILSTGASSNLFMPLFQYCQYLPADEATRPGLATNWTYNEDYTNMTIRLRDNAYWSDGEPFSADDVVYTFELLIANPVLQWGSYVNASVKSVTKIDDTTLLLEFYESMPRAHQTLFTELYTAIKPIAKHIWEGEDPLTFTNWPDPVGIGPFIPIYSTQERSISIRDDNWWGKDVWGLPEVEWVESRYFGSLDEVVEALIQNDLDLVHGIAKSLYRTVQENNPYVQVWDAENPFPRGIFPNVYKYPLSLSAVRRAISWAVNGSKVCEAINERPGGARTGFAAFGALDKFLDEEVLAKYDYDIYQPERAVAELEAIGCYKGEDGIWVTANGTRFGPWVFETRSVANSEIFALTVVPQLQEFGIDVTYHIGDAAVFKPLWRSGQWDMCFGWDQGATEDPYTSFSAFGSLQYVPFGDRSPTESSCNRWINATYDALLADLAATNPDDPAAESLYAEIYDVWLHELPFIFITPLDRPNVHNTKYWVNWPNATNPYGPPQPGRPSYWEVFASLEQRQVTEPDTPEPETVEVIPPYMYGIIGVLVVVTVGVGVAYTRRRP